MVKKINYILKFFLFLYQNTVIEEALGIMTELSSIKREIKINQVPTVLNLDQTFCRCGDVALQVRCEKAISN